MSFNIVDLVKDQVKGQLIGQMGNLLGNEGGKATSAVDSIIPALLSGVTGSASTNDGANSLFGAIQDQDDSLLDNMSSMLGGGQASTVVDNGNSVLSNLLGSGGLGKLAGALSSFSGVSKGGTSSLMGMLAPIVLGVLKRKVMGDGLNAGGLASMLSSQSQNIGASMPQGLTDQLGASGLLSSMGGIASAGAGAAGAVAAGAGNLAGNARDAAGNVADSARDGVANAAGAVGNVADSARDGVANAAGAVGDVAGSARDGVANAAGAVGSGVSNAADAVGDTANKGGSMFRWLLPVVALGALAWAAFTFLLPGSKDAATDAASTVGDGAAAVADTATDAATDAAATATDAVTDAASTATDAVADAVDPEALKGQLGGIFSGATETLSGITDVDSATSALPDLEELGTKIDSVSGMMDKIPEAARGPFTSIASGGMEQIQPMLDKVMAIPGVGDVVGPILEPIAEKMKAFAG